MEERRRGSEPLFLTLTGVKSLTAIPIVLIWSACLAASTWVSPPPGVDYYLAGAAEGADPGGEEGFSGAGHDWSPRGAS